VENTFFYTFSTISQTLAGAIALLAGFVLYRLQLLNADIGSLAERLAGWVDGVVDRKSDEMPGNDLFLEGKYAELLVLANKARIPEGNYYRAKTERERLGALLGHKTSFVRRFYISLYLTAGLITASVLILTNAPCLSTACWASWVLVGGALWFAGCILSYMWLLHSVFGEKSVREHNTGDKAKKRKTKGITKR
jgi:hypothetical protein